MRRAIIYATALALYAALMAVTLAVGTREAELATEAQLDYAVLDLHSTLAGAIDTMLGHVARTAVRHIGKPSPLPRETMDEIAAELDIDEINVATREGEIIASNDPHCMGVVMAGDPVMDEFMELTNGVTATVSQPFRPHARNPAFRAKYLAAAFPCGNGFVQVGLEERRLAKMLPAILGYIFDEWLLGKTGFFLCADAETGRLVSNPARHRDEAANLAETGYDSAARPREFVLDGKAPGRTTVQRLFGETCDCRSAVFAGHRFVAALPRREYYTARNNYAAVFAVLLFAVIGAFAFFTDRIFRDSGRMKAFYLAEENRRAKDMEIAKTIQNSALPAAAPESPFCAIDASMQAAKEVGGDFYDHFTLDATHMAFLIADVSGKGITAALYMMTAKSLIKNTLLSDHDPAAALTKANAELCRNNPANMFLTAWVGVLDIETGVVTYANAGHNPPVRIAARRGADGAARLETVSPISGPLLAFMDGAVYKARKLKLERGDTLFLYTDGVTEALDDKGRLFGDERLADALAAAPEPNPHALCMIVRAAVAAFSTGVPQADDITVLAVRFLAPRRVISRTFAPESAGVAAASDFLDETLGTIDGGAAVSPALHIILDEICSNIVKHSGASGFEVEIEEIGRPSRVRITFIDDGSAYDPLSHTDPDTTLPAEERPIGGLGIMMVKKMSDAVSYRRSRNRNYFVVEKLLPA